MPTADRQSSVPEAPRRVTLLTDFGTADGYVGAMKGVIATIAPAAIIDDISHDIAAGDVAAGAWCLATCWRLYPAGTVHVCVVDPGVGSSRRALAVAAAGQYFVAPDNGLLTDVLRLPDAIAVEVRERRVMRAAPSRTFHGRDVFAPVGAHLAVGTAVADLGPIIDDAVQLAIPVPHTDTGSVSGEVVHVDRFGNLITNIPATALTAGARVRVPGDPAGVRIVATYADAEPGELVALVGSADVLEIAVRDGSAADRLGGSRGMTVVVTRG